MSGVGAAAAVPPPSARWARRLAVGSDDDAALCSLALALRVDTLVGREREVDHPAVSGRHRVELDRPAAGYGALRHALCQCGQLARPAFAVLLDVQDDTCGAPFGSTEREVDEELEGAQGLAAVADEQTGVVALDIDDGHLVAPAGTAYGGRRIHVQPVEESAHDAECGGGGAVPSHDAPDADPGILGTDPEDAAAPLANDVDFDFVATDAELQRCELDCLLHCLG